PRIPRMKDPTMIPMTVLHVLNFSSRRRRNDGRSHLARLRRNAMRNWVFDRLEDRTLLSRFATTTTMTSSARDVLFGAPVALTAQVQPGAAADLVGDWSESANPNPASFGTWSYRQGSSLLAHFDDWIPFNGPVTQPAWAPGVQDGDF